MRLDKKSKSNPENVSQINTESGTLSTILDADKEKIKEIAGKARELRVAMKIGYEQFALQAGINRNSYYRFERSAKTGENFTIALLLKVIRGLNISVSDFFIGIA